MPHTTLTVPAKYAEDFRAALAHELAEEADLVKKERKKYLEAVEYERHFPDKKADDAEWRSIVKLLDSDAELFRQAVTDASGDIEISMQDDRGVVSFACETVAREVIAPRLVEALHSTPLDTNQAAELRELIERLTWAIDQAARIHESHFPSKKEVA